LGIFCYVGAEVTIGSNLVVYMKENFQFSAQEASAFLAFYWGGAMIGRFVGSFSMSKMKSHLKYSMMGILSVLAFLLISWAFGMSLDLNMMETDDMLLSHDVFYFIIAVVLNYFIFILAKSDPSRTLGLFAIVNILLLVVMLTTDGGLSLWAILSVGLFNSIMFSNVFTLAIDRLGKYTSQGSSLLVMMILGGAALPPMQGLLADRIGSLTYSFALPILCYLYLVWYGFVGSSMGKNKTN